MAADTPIKLGASGKGGSRPNSGTKKNVHRIAISDLREALEKELGIPYVEMLAQTQLKLFNDFKEDKNVKEYVNFTESMSKRLIEQPVQEINVTTIKDMTDEQLIERISELVVPSNAEQTIKNENDPSE